MNATYLATARLLTEIAPVVFESGIFALKGGTAINLFLRDMPRLSVDLDLVFTDHRLPRAEALTAINEALRAGRDRLAKRKFKAQAVSAADMGETKLLVQRDDLSIKVEVNTVIRGTVHPTQRMALTAAASDALMADLELPLLSPEDTGPHPQRDKRGQTVGDGQDRSKQTPSRANHDERSYAGRQIFGDSLQMAEKMARTD